MTYDLVQPLMLYSSVDDTAYNRFHARDNKVNRLISRWCPTTELIPFQISRPTVVGTPVSIYLVDFDGNQTDITSTLSADWKRFSSATTDFFVYTGNTAFSALTQGKYYLYVTDGGSIDHYSEDFGITANYANGVKIEFRHSTDIGNLLYDTNLYQYSYKNRIWLDTQVMQTSDFDTFQKETKDRRNIANVYYSVSSPIYEMELPAIDVMLMMALEFMTMHDEITITTQEGIVKQINNVVLSKADTSTKLYKTGKLKFRYDTLEVGNLSNQDIDIIDSSENLEFQLEGDESGDFQDETGTVILTETN